MKARKTMGMIAPNLQVVVDDSDEERVKDDSFDVYIEEVVKDNMPVNEKKHLKKGKEKVIEDRCRNNDEDNVKSSKFMEKALGPKRRQILLKKKMDG